MNTNEKVNDDMQLEEIEDYKEEDRKVVSSGV